jgi:uncharacterized membrane protein
MRHKAPEKIAQFVHKVQDESITQPPGLMRKWHDLKAQMLSLGAQELQKVAAQLQNPEEKAAYLQAAKDIKRAAVSIKNLPIPEQRVIKSLENLPEWMKLRAKKKWLMAQQWKVASRQLGYPMLRKKARHVERKAKALLRALNKPTVEVQESADINIDETAE